MTAPTKTQRDALNEAILTIYESQSLLEIMAQSMLDKSELETLRPLDCVHTAKGMDACARLLKLVVGTLNDIDTNLHWSRA